MRQVSGFRCRISVKYLMPVIPNLYCKGPAAGALTSSPVPASPRRELWLSVATPGRARRACPCGECTGGRGGDTARGSGSPSHPHPLRRMRERQPHGTCDPIAPELQQRGDCHRAIVCTVAFCNPVGGGPVRRTEGGHRSARTGAGGQVGNEPVARRDRLIAALGNLPVHAGRPVRIHIRVLSLVERL
jgi:hypothetical protein